MRRTVRLTPWKIGQLLPLLLAIGLGGCSRTATVTGRVTYRGRPVVHGSVTFVQDARTARSGVIQPDGSYSVENVPMGTMEILVFSRSPKKGRSVPVGQPSDQHGQKEADLQKAVVKEWFPLPRKYEAAATSGLRCTVGSRRVTHDLELN